MTVADAFALVSRAIDEGRAANGYLVCGDLKGGCAEFANLVLGRLFPEEPEQIASRSHPDVVYLEPQGKSRTIKVARGKDDDGPGMRDGLIEPMAVTAFSGGWKVGVIVGADRMQEEAANAFLKTLEEPPPKTMFLLLTDQPDSILPTIVSRTQRIDLPMPPGVLEGDAGAAVAEVFGSAALDGTHPKAVAARRLAEILSGLKDEAEPEDAPIVRKTFYKTVMSFVRGWMVSGALPRHLAFRNIEAVEEAYRRSCKFISDETVLCSMVDKMTWP